MNYQYQINADWNSLADKIALPNQCVLVLGASDVGKSTFCRFLIDYACAASMNAALVDADVGQSQIGPPTTIGLKHFTATIENEIVYLPFGGYGNKHNLPNHKLESDSAPSNDNIEKNINTTDNLYFVGSLSPNRNLLPMLTGTRLMVDSALNAGSDFIVVDTTGFVHNGAAEMLKQQKIELIRPNHVVCIGRSKALERIVGCFGNVNWLTIHYLQPHRLVRMKSSEARKRNRLTKFKQYFSDSQPHEVSFEQIRGGRIPFFNGRIANHKELDILSGLTETEIDYAEWGHRSLCLIGRRKLSNHATNSLRNYLSLTTVSAETITYFEKRLVGMVNEEGVTCGIGIIENVDFEKQVFSIRCAERIASATKVLQFGEYQHTGNL